MKNKKHRLWPKIKIIGWALNCCIHINVLQYI